MVQASSNVNIQDPFLQGSFKENGGTYAQDAAEANPVVNMTVLGKITKAAGTPAAGGTNTGNGTATLFSIIGSPVVGIYQFVLTAALVGKLVGPDGSDILTGIALTDGGATVVKAGGLQFTITDGGTAFIATDYFDLPVEAGSLKYKALESDAVDGSAVPAGIYRGASILAATIVAGDVEVLDVVVGGDGIVNESSVIFHNGSDTLDTVVDGRTIREHFADLGLFFKDVVDVENYENA